MGENTTAHFALPYPSGVGKVNLGAIDFKELAERLDTLLNERLVTYKSYAAAATLKSGELAEQTKAGETFTLPAAATANQTIGVFCGTAFCQITTSGGALIVGDAIPAASKTASITLLEAQHVVLQSNGSNWLILAGGPSAVSGHYSALQTGFGGEVVTLSSLRPVSVVITTANEAGGPLKIGGIAFGFTPLSCILAPGESISLEASGAHTFQYRYRLL